MAPLSDPTAIDMIHQLLAELAFVWRTGDLRDSEKNSQHIREEAAKLLGYESYAGFVADGEI